MKGGVSLKKSPHKAGYFYYFFSKICSLVACITVVFLLFFCGSGNSSSLTHFMRMIPAAQERSLIEIFSYVQKNVAFAIVVGLIPDLRSPQRIVHRFNVYLE